MDSPIPPTKVDLALIPLDELINEIFKRHHSVVIGAVIHKDYNHYQIIRKFSGNRYSCLAMLSNIESLINKVENESLGPTIEQ